MKKMFLVAALSSCVCGFSTQLSTKVGFPVIANQKTDLLPDLLNFSRFKYAFDMFILNSEFDADNVKEGMSQRYFGNKNQSLEKTVEQMRKFAAAVREGALYEQVAKFVGRVEVGGGQTGTGTLVHWKNMPEGLKGRVVITCGHNHRNWVMGSSEGMYIKEKSRRVTDIDENLVNDLGLIDQEGLYLLQEGTVNKSDMYFTPDFGTTFDIWDAQPVEDSIEITRCYFFGRKSLADLAVLILKKPVTDANGSKVDGVDLGDIMANNTVDLSSGKFTIGYGGLSLHYYKHVVHPLVGWNLKKKNMEAVWTHHFRDTFMYEGLSFGPSDSGAPIVAEIEGRYRILGIHTGGSDYDLANQRNRLSAVAAYERDHFRA
ncbi:MAG: hypothetical protein LBQ43_03735 [Holosporales bacterium]|jgi:hypothetical protein|nr:hypothetical protein [Holosporales bacterium]